MSIELHNQAVEKIEQIAETYYDLGNILTKIVDEATYEELGYVGSGAFEKYCEEELGRSYQVVRSYIRIYTNLTAVNINKEDLKGISFRAAEQISRIVTEETKEDWLEQARSLSVRQLTAKISSIINAAKKSEDNINIIEGIEDKTYHKLGFKYVDDDAVFIQQALHLADINNNCDGNHNMSLKCALQDYVTLVGDRHISLESMLMLINDRYGTKLTIQQALASKEQGVQVNA